MRIVYMLSENLNRTEGGIVHFLAVARGLNDLDHKVVILAPQYSRSLRRFPPLGSIYIPLPGRSVFSFLLFQVLAAAVFPFIAILHRPDVLMVRGGTGLGFLAHVAARLCRVPVVLEINGITWAEQEVRGFPVWQCRLTRLTALLECRTCDHVIAVTPQIGEELIRSFNLVAERVHAIQNGADPDEFDRSLRESARKSLGLNPEDFVVGYTGAFTPWHGVMELVASAAELPAEVRAKVRYVLVGKGALWAPIRSFVALHGLERTVLLPGPASRAEIARHLAAFDLGVLLNADKLITRFGSTSLKFWEYLAAGLPVLITDNCNLTPLVTQYGMGSVVSNPTPATIAHEIALAYQRRAALIETGLRNKRLVIERFSWQHITDNVARVLTQAVKRVSS